MTQAEKESGAENLWYLIRLNVCVCAFQRADGVRIQTASLAAILTGKKNPNTARTGREASATWLPICVRHTTQVSPARGGRIGLGAAWAVAAAAPAHIAGALGIAAAADGGPTPVEL